MSCGEFEPLTQKQRALLEEFKVKVKDLKKPYETDDYIVRWLIAREWDLKKAEKMLRDSMEWRKQYGTDTILENWKVPEVMAYMPGGYFGHDKFGHPIWYELLGGLDLKGMMFSISKKDIIKNRIRECEVASVKLIPDARKKFPGNLISKVVYIVDLEGIGRKHVWKPAIDIYTELLALSEVNYPEGLYCAYVINAPRIFPLLYGLVKPFLAPNTRGKIKILGSNWKEVLLKDIDADQLPVHWGGTATDPDGDPHCKSKISLGGTIPEKYRLKAATMENVDMTQFSTLTVNKSSTAQLEYVVDQPGSMLRWNFWTDDKDIGFGVYLRTGDAKQRVEDMVEMVPNSRVNSHMVPEADSLACETLGTYIILFDNSYSWVNAKKVSYLIEVVLPDAGRELQRLDSTNL